MKLGSLKPPAGARKKMKRVGRGPGSGHGTYSGRGIKGQKARMSGKPPAWFEGGQMPLQRRVPKRGFTNPNRVEAQAVNLDELARQEGVTAFTLETIYDLGLASRSRGPVKVLARGGIGRAIRVQAHRFSKAAREAIEAAGGTVEALESPRPKRRKLAPKARDTEGAAQGG